MKFAIKLLAAIVFLVGLGIVLLPEAPLNPDAPRVLVSIDRTLWNRLGLTRWTYARALRRAGIHPVLIDYASLGSELSAVEALENIDGLVLSGGGDVGAVHYGGDERISRDVNPDRDEFELNLLQLADDRNMPVLGVCRGAQLLNVHRGGTLGDFREDGPKYRRHQRFWDGHAVQIDADSRLARILERTLLDKVVTYHGQFVDVAGSGVEVVAFAPDGVPEAIEVRGDDQFGMIGVQWHAEVLPWNSSQENLFAAFHAAAKRYNAARSSQ